MAALTQFFNIRHIKTVAYTPQLNSYLERFHGRMMATVTALTNSLKSDWHKWLPVALYVYVYRTSTHTSTGYSPLEVLTGRPPRSDMDLVFPAPRPQLAETDYMRELETNLTRIYNDVRLRQQRTAEYNLSRRLKDHKPREFAVNDLVLVYCPERVEKLPNHLPRIKKMLDRFLGPFRITKTSKSGSRRRYTIFNTGNGKEET